MRWSIDAGARRMPAKMRMAVVDVQWSDRWCNTLRDSAKIPRRLGRGTRPNISWDRLNGFILWLCRQPSRRNAFGAIRCAIAPYDSIPVGRNSAAYCAGWSSREDLKSVKQIMAFLVGPHFFGNSSERLNTCTVSTLLHPTGPSVRTADPTDAVARA